MSNTTKLGSLGVQHVINRIGGKEIEDYFCISGDVVKDGEFCEVKTQNRFNNMFTIKMPYNDGGVVKGTVNLIKCLSVKTLLFVEYDNTDTIRIWDLPLDQRCNYATYITKDHRHMLGWFVKNMTLLDEVTDKDLANQFRSLSQSKFVKKNCYA